MDQLLAPHADLCDHAALLASLVGLLDDLPEKKFRHVCNRLNCGSAGGHLRHCIEFYQCFLEGLAARRVDYDSRRRDPDIETHPTAAISALEEIIGRIGQARRRHAPDLIIHVTESGETWLASTHARESRFLASHTIHHMALIAVLLRAQDVEIPADFGVAPSTLKFRAGQAEGH